MNTNKQNFNIFREYIIENSLFTKRQFSIILKGLNKMDFQENISSGAYYRQIKQCRRKIIRVLYSIIMLEYIEAIDPQTLDVLNRVSTQLDIMLQESHSDTEFTKLNDVIHMLSAITERLCIL
jgi:hypothetical protein